MDRCRLSCHELQSSPPLRLHLMPTSRVVRFIPPCGFTINTTTLSTSPSHIDRRQSIPTEHHRCRRERPSSSTAVVISSYPGSFMSKESVSHMIHDYTDVYILSSLSRVCIDCEQRIDRRTHDQCRLSCHELQSSPPLRFHLMPTSRVVRFISPCDCTSSTMTLSNTPSHIDSERGRLSQRGRSRREGPSTAWRDRIHDSSTDAH